MGVFKVGWACVGTAGVTVRCKKEGSHEEDVGVCTFDNAVVVLVAAAVVVVVTVVEDETKSTSPPISMPAISGSARIAAPRRVDAGVATRVATGWRRDVRSTSCSSCSSSSSLSAVRVERTATRPRLAAGLAAARDVVTVLVVVVVSLVDAPALRLTAARPLMASRWASASTSVRSVDRLCKRSR
jgi:hypothetical protein